MTEANLRLSEIGHTNAVVHSDAECRVIKAALREAEEALLCLPASAVTLRKEAVDEVRRYKIALAPHKKLPADIWLHIFQLCFELEFGGREVWPSPLQLLPQVCSGWRSNLMACPALWSNLRMNANSPRFFSRAKTWLSRAGDIPRSLKIISYDPIAVEKLLSLYPFRALDVTLFNLPYPEDFSALRLSKTPVESLLPLEELVLFSDMLWDGGRHRHALRVSLSPHRFPNLTCLTIGEPVIFPIFDDPCPFVTLPKLRKLVLHCPVPKFQCLCILRDATGIEECTMFVDSDSGPNSIVEGMVLPNLATLKLYFRSGRDTQPFLDMLTLPDLTSLNLGNKGDYYGCDETTLRRLAERSGMKKMRTLMISSTAAKRPNIGTLLRILPSLCRLEILTDIEPLSELAINRIGSGEFGPRLRALHLRGDQQLPSLLSIAEIRRQQSLGCPEIQVFVEDYPHPVRMNEESRIHWLRSIGIEFTLHAGDTRVKLYRRILTQ